MEIQFGATELNGENNKTVLKKLTKQEQPWMKKYTSTARTLVRGCWFFDFLTAIFGGIVNDRKSKLSQIASNAYNTALGPHHPWVLRKVASAAMVAVVSRETLIQNICKE